MASLAELAALRQLLAEVQDDLEQMDAIAVDLSGRRPKLERGSATPEDAAYAALQLHRWYTAAEAAFERIERTLVGGVPKGDAWHQDLLRLMGLPVEGARREVLRPEVARSLLPYLRFRHFLRHAYAVDLDPEKLSALVTPLDAVQAALRADVTRLLGDLRAALSSAEP